LLVAAVPCASSPFIQSQRVHTKERRTGPASALIHLKVAPRSAPAGTPHLQTDCECGRPSISSKSSTGVNFSGHPFIVPAGSSGL
jgi:hypothetical protein